MQGPDEIMRLSSSGTGVLVRIDGNTEATAATIRKTLKEINSEHVMFNVQTMEEIIADSLAVRRVSMIVLCVFAALALGLASVPLMQKPLSISSSDQQALAAGGRPRLPGQL